MLIVKGNIYRNVSEKEAEKYKQQGYTEVKNSGVKDNADSGRKTRKG